MKSDKTSRSKINLLIQEHPKGLVLLAPWLVAKGYSYELQQRYKKSGWLKSIGVGAMLKSDDPFMLSGAISALQTHANINLHIGGRSALELHGMAHYLQVSTPEVTLFAPGSAKLPSWFTKNRWNVGNRVHRITLFNDDKVGLTSYKDVEIEMEISSPARAIMECLSLCPNEFSLMEAYELMEGLASLRPKQVQELLENCKQHKVKRLFLCFAERAGHSWFKYIDTKGIDLGSSIRSFAENGVYMPKYRLVLPKEFATNE